MVIDPERKLVVGIDLGTTRSVIAWAEPGGKSTTIFNSEGEPTTPSVVLFELDGVTVGKEAVKASRLLPDQVATFVKREMGKDGFSKSIGGKTYPPEMIQSLILGKLKRDAESRLGRPVDRAVVTVPAYFNEPKRRSTIAAGELAGLEVCAVINEPTAAAIAWGVDKQSELQGPQTVLVYDLGGGTFDASLVRVDGRKFDVLATDGNAMLGGMDWDKCLARWIDDEFAAQSGAYPSRLPGGETFLLREAEELKHSLTSRRSVDVRLVFDSHRMQSKITRELFEELTAHLLDRTRFTISKLINESKISWIEVDRILLVGGLTRMPQIREMLAKETGIEPDASISADEAVAHGAAIYASMLEYYESAHQENAPENPPSLELTDVNSHHLGVIGIDKKTNCRVNHIMIHRNTPLPVTRVSRLETNTDNQPNVVVEVVEGGDATGRHSTSIGRCVIHGLPPHLAAGTPVDVSFRYDTDGLIHVEAVLPRTGQRANLTIDRSAGMSDAQRGELADILSELGLDD
ncbi:Chaperone protein DnaK [Rubripirellula tenax]|uniref:Chaperone protein DnaK n=1 Tax=Rubripirellula tenax TaxID=2528015 RepID=A0A5C6FB17_9BACT|nr:Hsp70 family protein [Rubripirellula tenax]TWU56779.1 Chaperone protein DnaK [Rubripirellula tenax]